MTLFAVVLGTRPELIKMIGVIKELEKANKSFFLISTNQQADLLNQTAQSLGISFNYTLKSRGKNADMLDFASSAIRELKTVIEDLNPSKILVHGDTMSTFIGAMCGFFLNIPISHIEAGLRTKDLANPWPEEGIRRMVDSISTQLFCPTFEDESNILLDINQEVFITGNTGVDSALMYGNHIDINSRFNLVPRIVLVTLHRRESQKDYLKVMLEEILKLSKYGQWEFELIVHPNPRVVDAIQNHIQVKDSNISVIKPLGFVEMMEKLGKVWACVTDSGGLALDCVSLGIPVGIVRDATEESAILSKGNAKLIGRVAGGIENFLNEIACLETYLDYCRNSNPLGDGKASERIVREL